MPSSKKNGTKWVKNDSLNMSVVKGGYGPKPDFTGTASTATWQQQAPTPLQSARTSPEAPHTPLRSERRYAPPFTSKNASDNASNNASEDEYQRVERDARVTLLEDVLVSTVDPAKFRDKELYLQYVWKGKALFHGKRLYTAMDVGAAIVLVDRMCKKPEYDEVKDGFFRKAELSGSYDKHQVHLAVLVHMLSYGDVTEADLRQDLTVSTRLGKWLSEMLRRATASSVSVTVHIDEFPLFVRVILTVDE